MIKVLVHAETSLLVAEKYLWKSVSQLHKAYIALRIMMHLSVHNDESVSVEFPLFKFHPFKFRATTRHFNAALL